MEDYKKLYEQTQSKMKEFIKRWDGIKLSSNDLFTEELKQIVEIESEDERIRKEIIEMVRNWASVHYITKEQFSERMTWLEKQSEPNPYSGVSFKYNGHTWGMCARDNGVEILVDGEIKGRIFLDNKPQGKSALEAIKEKKVDNEFVKSLCVEPKFKVGDWVVRGNTIAQILDIQEQYYIGLDINGKDFVSSRFLSGNKIHLWTIQDAKDGDVLIDKSHIGECVFIFKEARASDIKTDVNNPLAIIGYCGINHIGFTSQLSGLGFGDTVNCTYYPATKEQRDTLMKAMNNAGYKWDADKKELFHNQNQNG